MCSDRILRILYILDWIQSVAQIWLQFQPLSVAFFLTAAIFEMLSCCTNPFVYDLRARSCMIFYVLARIYSEPSPDWHPNLRGTL
jgi:hypothetical protein